MIRAAKGYRMRRSKLYRYASDAVDHGRKYAYRDRRVKKRTYRLLWQVRINAAARAAGTTYSRFMVGLKAAKVALDRKVGRSIGCVQGTLAAIDVGATDHDAEAEQRLRVAVEGRVQARPGEANYRLALIYGTAAFSFHLPGPDMLLTNVPMPPRHARHTRRTM